MAKVHISLSSLGKLLPGLLALIGEVADDLKDGKLSDEELKALGSKVVALIVDIA